MAGLQFPGPDGGRPSVLAERAGVSKQAMNQLFGTLETLGCVARSPLTHGRISFCFGTMFVITRSACYLSALLRGIVFVGKAAFSGCLDFQRVDLRRKR
jgi:hypothetical protein